MKKSKGYTLIELLIVMAVFAVISVVASETVILTLRGTYKSDSISKVRQSLDYAMSSMERQLRGAESITSACDGTSTPQISFIDQNANPVTFTCVGVNSVGNPASIASSSGSLTSDNITLTDCSFTCMPGTNNSSPSIVINAVATDTSGQNTPVSTTTQVTLRSY